MLHRGMDWLLSFRTLQQFAVLYKKNGAQGLTVQHSQGGPLGSMPRWAQVSFRCAQQLRACLPEGCHAQLLCVAAAQRMLPRRLVLSTQVTLCAFSTT